MNNTKNLTNTAEGHSELIGFVITRVTEEVNVADIEVDKLPMNPSTLALVDHMRSGGEIPPIKIYKKVGGGYKIKDGRHRILASKLLGIDKIVAKFSLTPMSVSAL